MEMQMKSGNAVGWNNTSLLYAAGLALASELIHLWVLPSEFVISPLRGLFFLLVAVFQGMLAASLFFGPGKWIVRFGIFLNVGIVAVWAFTRFVNFAGFPRLLRFERLPVGLLDLAATTVEIALLVLLFRIGGSSRERAAEPTLGMSNRKLARTAERKEGKG